VVRIRYSRGSSQALCWAKLRHPRPNSRSWSTNPEPFDVWMVSASLQSWTSVGRTQTCRQLALAQIASPSVAEQQVAKGITGLRRVHRHAPSAVSLVDQPVLGPQLFGDAQGPTRPGSVRSRAPDDMFEFDIGWEPR
jgi:hypothetical protein